jgi:undecaprenyl pyrophosphate synthase
MHLKKLNKNNDKINEKNLSKYLQTKNIPDPEF